MVYRTKKEVLEALGKNEKDVRYLDRAIARWEVVVEWWGYVIMKEYISNLQRKVKDLEKKLQKEIERNEWMWNIVQAKSVLDEEDRQEYLKQIHDLEMENWKLNKELTELEQKKWVIERELDQIKANQGDYTSSDDLKFQMDENERLEREKKELVEWVKKAFYKYCKGWNWEIFKQVIGLSSLLEDVCLEE